MRVILEDTRQQTGKHDRIASDLRAMGYRVERSKLYVGDYQYADSGAIAVDTKKDVLELASDVNQQHARFSRELMRAQDAGISLVILTEEVLPDGLLENWKSPVNRRTGKPYTMTNPATLKKAMLTMQERYGVRFRFCHKSETAGMVLRFLDGLDII